jgi:hypothetical protein
LQILGIHRLREVLLLDAGRAPRASMRHSELTHRHAGSPAVAKQDERAPIDLTDVDVADLVSVLGTLDAGAASVAAAPSAPRPGSKRASLRLRSIECVGAGCCGGQPLGHIDLPQADGGSTTVFDPTGAAEARVQKGPFTMSWADDAEPEPGNGRLVVMPHGSGGSACVHGLQVAHDVAMPQDRHGAPRGKENTVRRWLLLLLTHVMVGIAGFAAGIYTLPILIAPDPPSADAVGAVAAQALYKGRFRRDLPGSDALHWGEGEVAISATAVSLQGRLAPGPDYKLYLSPEFVDTEAAFERVKPRMQRVGDVRTFTDFVVPLPPGVDPAAHTTVVVWCETFREFITAARYR